MKKFITLIFSVILCGCILINILSAFNQSLFGIRVFRIGSGSMEPYLKVNSLIITKEESDYQINDIVTFKENNYYITHRIIEIKNNLITTKGDNNNTKDTPIEKNKIVGKVIYRFRIFGFLSFLLLKPFSLILIFVVGVFIIIILPVKKPKGKHEEV